MEIERKYQRQYGYQSRVVLIPVWGDAPAPRPQPAALPQTQAISVEDSLSGVHWVPHEKPTELEIANYVLTKVRLVRIGERVFEYTALLEGNAAVKATRKRLGKENKRGYEGICLR